MPVTQEQPQLSNLAPVEVPQTRTLYITGSVDSDLAHRAVLSLEQMDRGTGNIRIVLNSEGGSEQDGYAIYDAITMCRNKVIIDGYGSVMSIAAAIFQAGDERRMAPNADFMIHNGSIDVSDTTVLQDQVTAIANEIAKGNQRYYQILSLGSQQPLETIAAWCKDETTFNAREAVECGFADAIIEPLKTKIPKKSRRRKRS